jgi:dephospho-CoA kinase
VVATHKLSKPIVGLAGGIGAGKSTVAGVFESLGAAVIDSDRLNHEQLSDPEVVATLRSWWGDAIVADTGGVDRKAIADVVFEAPEELKRLQALIYPRIDRRRDELLDKCDADSKVKAIVLDTPKLFESGLDQLCDAVVFVEADRDIRLRRAGQARGWSERELTRREKLQNRLDFKRARADYTVVNNSNIVDLRTSIERILASVLASFAGAGGCDSSTQRPYS